MPRGGKREGAGRKRKYGTEATKLQRVPESWTVEDVETAVKARAIIEELQALVTLWQRQAADATTQSKTGLAPRTYDKALRLLEELNRVLTQE